MVEVEFKREEESQKFFVKVLWEKLRSNRGIQEEDGDILHLGVPRPWQRTEVEENENQPFTKNSTSQKMKMRTKSHGCPT